MHRTRLGPSRTRGAGKRHMRPRASDPHKVVLRRPSRTSHLSGVGPMYEHGGSQSASFHSSTQGQSNGHGGTSSVTENSLFTELLLNPALGARRMNVAPGKVLYEPGSDAKALYFIHRGQIRAYKVDETGNGRLLEILGP